MSFTERTGLYRRFNRVWHVMVALSSLAVGYFVMQRNNADLKNDKQHFIFGECLLDAVLFMTAFSFNFGMTLWVTFVAGIVMYKNLPTHTFGHIQSKLFPCYFLVGSVTGLTMLLVAVYSSRDIAVLSLQQKTLLATITIIFLTNLCNGIYIGPQSTAIMFDKHKMEKEYEDKDKLDSNPQYKALKKSFGMMHGISSLLNIFSLGSACYILYWIATLLTRLS